MLALDFLPRSYNSSSPRKCAVGRFVTGDDTFGERFGVGNNICRTHFLLDGLYLRLDT